MAGTRQTPPDEAGALAASRHSAVETLRDGSRIEIRSQRSEDRAELLDAFGRMGPESRYTRFFSPREGLSDAEVAYFMNADFVNHVALVAIAETPEARRIVGAGRYIVTRPGAAEVAFGVDDAHHGRGIASALLRHLVAIAREAQLDALHAEVLTQNAAMLKVFERCGVGISCKREQEVVHVTLRLRSA